MAPARLDRHTNARTHILDTGPYPYVHAHVQTLLSDAYIHTRIYKRAIPPPPHTHIHRRPLPRLHTSKHLYTDFHPFASPTQKHLQRIFFTPSHPNTTHTNKHPPPHTHTCTHISTPFPAYTYIYTFTTPLPACTYDDVNSRADFSLTPTTSPTGGGAGVSPAVRRSLIRRFGEECVGTRHATRPGGKNGARREGGGEGLMWEMHA